jgi:Gamma-glutamyl cyclotransferase, AIG2-like
MKYFAYGMNTNKQQMAIRCPKAQSLGPAKLPDHEFRFSIHADIIPNPEFDTDGVLWEITDECERALDALEGFPLYYLKKQVRVLYNGNYVDAMTYYMTGDLPDDYPSDVYLDMLFEGYAEHGVDDDQIYDSLYYIDNLRKRELDAKAHYFQYYN